MKTKNKEDLVSVIIVNYNNSKYINRCINSVLKQSYKNIEIIFVDDKSDDDSLNKLIKFKNKLKIIKNNKKFYEGSYDQIKSYYTGIKKSKGKLVFFLDSDDFFKKEKVKYVVNYFKKNSCKIVFDLPIIFYNKKKRQNYTSSIDTLI